MVENDKVRKGQRARDHTPVHRWVRKALPADNVARRAWRRWKPPEISKRGDATVRRSDPNVMVTVKGSGEPCGVYLYGACDAEKLLDMGAYVADDLRASLAIRYGGHVTTSRPDVLLQKLDGISTDDTAEVTERLSLSPDYFRNDFFEPTMDLGRLHDKPVKKHAVVTNIAAATTRTLYRHKELGFLIDPGGWWFAQSSGAANPDKATLKWFRKNFASVGRLSVDEWETLFRQVHAEIVARTGAHVLMLNLLTIEPQDLTHNYGGRTEPETVRRRSFALRLYQVCEELGIDLIDADRLLKESGVRGAFDFAHMPREQMAPVMHEGAALLTSRGIIPTKDER